MMVPQKPSAHLKGPARTLTQDELTALSLQAIVIVPDQLSRLCDIMEDVADQLTVIALYADRAGRRDGLITDKDFENLDKGADDGKGNGSGSSTSDKA